MSKRAKLTPKQLAYCHYRANLGMGQSAAYKKAYNAQNMADNTIYSHASRLEANDKIAARIEEIYEEQAQALGITERGVLAELWSIAKTGKTEGARVAALDKISGIMGIKTQDRYNPQNMTDDEIDQVIQEYEQSQSDGDTLH